MLFLVTTLDAPTTLDGSIWSETCVLIFPCFAEKDMQFSAYATQFLGLYYFLPGIFELVTVAVKQQDFSRYLCMIVVTSASLCSSGPH